MLSWSQSYFWFGSSLSSLFSHLWAFPDVEGGFHSFYLSTLWVISLILCTCLSAYMSSPSDIVSLPDCLVCLPHRGLSTLVSDLADLLVYSESAWPDSLTLIIGSVSWIVILWLWSLVSNPWILFLDFDSGLCYWIKKRTYFMKDWYFRIFLQQVPGRHIKVEWE